MIDDKVIEKIKKMMAIEQINQKDLASKLGTTEVSISRYLRGNRKLTIDFVVKTAYSFHVSIDWLLCDM